LKNIYWHDGMLMGPQHLIYNDERLQSLFQYKLTALYPHAWGIESVSLNQHSLENGIVEILALKAHFSDGAVVSIPGNANVETLVVDISVNSQRLAVYLCLRPFLSVNEISGEFMEGNEQSQRCTAQMLDGDLFNDGELEKCEYQLLLIAGEKAPANYLTIKLCELRVNENRVDVRPYIPPLIRHSASSLYLDMLKKLSAQLIQFLGNAQKSRDAKRTKSTASSNNVINAVSLVSGLIYKLGIWLNGENMHPHNIHQQLAEAYVQLYSILNREPLNAKQMLLLKYDHGRIYSNLNLLIGKYSSCIENYYKKIKVVKQLSFDGTYFHTELTGEMSNIDKIGFMVSGGHSSFPEQVKIASRQLMPMLIANSISGLSVEPLPSLPLSGSMAANAEFYELHKEGEIWDSIVRYENLAIYASNKMPDCQISLLDISGI